jgi:hypothetical protein
MWKCVREGISRERIVWCCGIDMSSGWIVLAIFRTWRGFDDVRWHRKRAVFILYFWVEANRLYVWSERVVFKNISRAGG